MEAKTTHTEYSLFHEIFGNSFMAGHRSTSDPGSRDADDTLDGLNGLTESVSTGVPELAAAVFLRASSTWDIWDRKGSCSRREISIC